MRRPLFPSLLLLLLLIPAAAGAVQLVDLRLAELAGDGWQARGIHLQLGFGSDARLGGRLHIDRLRLSALDQELRDLRLDCPEVVLQVDGYACPRGRLQGADGLLPAARVEVDYQTVSGRLRLRLRAADFAGGRLDLRLDYRPAGWELQLEGRRLDADRLLALARRLGQTLDYSASGRLDLQAELAAPAGRLQWLRLQLVPHGLGFSNPDSTQAAEQLGGRFEARLRRGRGRWQIRLDAAVDGGFLYLDPLGVDFEADPARLRGRLAWHDGGRLSVEGLELDQPGLLRAVLHGEWRPGEARPLAAMDLELAELRLPGAYRTYLQPWLFGTLGGDLESSGRLSGRLRVQEGRLQALQLDLEGLDLHDRQGRFGLRQLAGRLDWADDGAGHRSQISWSGGQIYRIELGAASLPVVSRGQHFELAAPARIPVFDGALLIDDWRIEHPGTSRMAWQFDGVLTPLSLTAVSRALDWPPFAGQLSGMIPEVRYADGELRVGGVLLVRVFDGDITLRNLRLQRPFGRVPALSADLEIKGLDLETLTRTFSFGKIEGRLDGRVRGLRMLAWKPIAFDACFATPEGDRSRHRISQQAVDTLSNIGGGGFSGALSRTFLGLFEEFPYRRLGLCCRLENGVCQMRGVAPAASGYYIVQGRLLPPRLDIVGYAERVDWQTLLARLKAAVTEGAPTLR
ncbi:hypothetical protein QVG61_03380 [Thiohalobacter sp. IOR34]|uniref:hypothetical protein n=1 Tax=Thiohalobacter sp. IOR34 TaxID=3057176 RepID=UPI0025B22EB6|nr:hypothetical protein [Thiohalobacter sp. IOR34]WJW76149.1 hypothetical protein QVG61_03380 [Thiohalobacter sp. IOR34]